MNIARASGTAVAFPIALAVSVAALSAQSQSGEIFGRVTDPTGAVLPGVIVTLTSPALIRPQTTTTTSTGAYRFPTIPIGIYSVSFELTGFTRVVRPDIRIETGFSAEVNAELQLLGLQETLTVAASSPVIDTRSTASGQTFTRALLERIPSARDPWVVMEQTPGIIMSQQNVGGNKSGQQSTFVAHGTGNNEVWNVDGGNITDMASSSSSMYFDFDAFEEIQIQTGGSDASVQSSGVSINLVTKSGSNTLRGSSRLYVVDDKLQDDNVTPALRAQGAGFGNPIKNIKDYGAEVGGPIARSRAWFWGAAGYQDIRVGVVGFVRPGGDPDNRNDLETDLTTLKTYNAKVQYQWTRPHKSTFLFVMNDKARGTRDAGPLNPPETTYRQTAPVHVYKGMHQWIPTNRLTLEGQAMFMPDGGFLLDFHEPSLVEVQSAFDIATQMNSRSNRRDDNRRPQKELRADGNYLLAGVAGGDHAIKFGGGWRDTPFGFTRIRGGHAQARFTSGAPTEANLYRDSNTETALSQTFGYVQDAWTRGRLTVNAGVRFDDQDDEALPSHVDANPIVPDLLPAIDFAGVDSGVAFFEWSPRVGLTWNVSGNGKTIVKGNYAVYWGTGITTAASVNPVSEVTLRFPWNDLNGDGFVQRSELTLTRLLNFTGNYDPARPTAPVSSTSVDPNLKNDRTDEASGGFEHEVAAGFSVGALYIYRNYPRYQNFSTANGVRAADYVPMTRTFACANTTCDQPAYTVTYYELPFQLPGAQTLRNALRTRRYHALEFTARKRFSDRWMVYGSANLQSTTIHYAGPDVSYQDPTDIEKLNGAQTGTANARWFGKLSGLYVLPWRDVAVSGFFNVRQGYPYNRVIQSPTRSGGIGRFDVDIDRWGDVRLDNLYQIDVRIEKQFPLAATRCAVAFDVFNLFNAATVLDRQERQNVTTANFVQEILAPRVARLGVRINF